MLPIPNWRIRVHKRRSAVGFSQKLREDEPLMVKLADGAEVDQVANRLLRDPHVVHDLGVVVRLQDRSARVADTL